MPELSDRAFLLFNILSLLELFALFNSLDLTVLSGLEALE